MVSTFWIIYLLVGLFFVVLEYKLNIVYMVDFKEMNRAEALCVVGAQIAHYLRVWVTFPLYLVEDVLIIASNKVGEEEE